MSDEIKEILDNFKDYELRYKQCNENQFIIFYRDIHLLLDYITNLQTIEREYSSLLSENAKLQQENDRLNNIINYIWQVFENGGFEDGCDCIEIYDYLKELKENNCE